MRIILHFLKPYKGLCFFAILCVIVDVAGALLIPTITANMINLALNRGNFNEVIGLGIVMFIIAVITGIGALIGCWICSKLSALLGKEMKNALYQKSLIFSSTDFEQFGTSSMITRTLNDMNVIQQAFVMFMQMVLPVPIMCIMGVVFAFNINQDMGFLILGIMAFVMIVATLIVKQASSIYEKLQKFLDRVNVVLRENITGVRIIRAFNKENHESDRMKKSFSDYAESAIQANRLFAALDSLAMVAINICIVLILYIGGNKVGLGNMEIGDITAVTDYAIWILFYIVMAQMVFILIPKAMICIRRMEEVLSHNPEILDGSNTVFTNIEGEDEVIKFENATFRFKDAEEDTLSHLSFVCRRGETTAIIGGTGSGKSTIAKLILRYYDVSSGSICLKGTNIKDITQHALRDRIAYVPQKAWLFSGSIADNLKYGKPDANEEEMKHALHVAQSEFVYALDDELQSYVAQGGTNFSGGQKQRISIARALIKNADVYIFDDSFSALDFKTDAALRKALKEETKNTAVVIIAQRISTIIQAEQIIVLDDGKIVGIGNHKQLMKTCKTYKDIADSQMKGGNKNGK